MHEQLLKDLERDVDAGRMTDAQALDTLAQKAHFDARRRAIAQAHYGKIVGFVGGRMFVEDSVHGLLDATRKVPGQLYFEPVPLSLLRVSR